MLHETPQSKLNPLTETCVSCDTVRASLRAEIRDTIAPMAVTIDYARIENWAKHNGLQLFNYPYLLKELKIWGPYFCHRPVSQLKLNVPFSLMDASGLTELTHCIGQGFNLHRGSHIEHAVSLRPQDVTRENIALLKGLYFNHLYLCCNTQLPLTTTMSLFKLIREFNFDFSSLMLQFQSSEPAELTHLCNLLERLQPHSICFINASKVQLNLHLNSVKSLLNHYGYHPLTHSCVVRVRSVPKTKLNDVLSVGPMAQSCMGRLHITHLEHPSNYHLAIDNNWPPVAEIC